MKKLLLLYLFMGIIFLLYLIDYQSRGAKTNLNTKPEGFSGDIDENYVIVTFQAGIDYWKNILKGFEDAGQALNVSVEYRGAAQYDVKEQITVLEQIIARKPSGIALSAIHPEALNDTIYKAIHAGIPVVLFDSDAPNSDAYTYVGTDNYKAGVKAADEMAKMINYSGKVAVITLSNQQNHRERLEGFKETIANHYTSIELVNIKDGKGDQLVSEQVAIELLNEIPDLNGIFVTEANGGVGVGEAAVSLNKQEKVKIISFDTDKQTLDMVKNGTLSATLAQGTWNMGYWSLLSLFHIKHKMTEPENDPVATNIIPRMDTGITLVTPENVENYYAK